MVDSTTDAELRHILETTKVIACVGVSPNPVRPSHYVARYLSMRGYRVLPINPVHAGKVLLGETVLADFSEVPEGVTVDMVDIFRRSEHVPDVVEAALQHIPDGLRTIWMQIGVINEPAAERARQAGLRVVQDRCPKIEYQRLFGELRMGGFNTGVISSKLPKL
ncbi:CoA-binding protein [Alphaproteobacteria bacterium KMM 3653]|uniref:CoA-binding protein n=1 Tax=Harenicola maris TaxID=2841044 RepID=A0AAP2CR68_9RHOB|nr:CoA-binding protein [Harenicola maris]